jgi:splicing factor 3B subunit 3
MHLYHLSLQSGSAIHAHASGTFSSAPNLEIAVARSGSGVLELLRLDRKQAKLESVTTTNVFGVIRSLASFRLNQSNVDYLIVGSDSGSIAVLRFDEASRAFVQVHNEVFGKTGCRRIVPGQYLACDPHGRSVMIAAIEKQKFVYTLNLKKGEFGVFDSVFGFV